MTTRTSIPSPEFTRCGLAITTGESSDPVVAWSWLPRGGQGWLSLSDQVVRFSPTMERAGYLIEAEVVDGDSTTVVKHDSGTWRFWRYDERPGDTHRRVEERFRSSAPKVGSSLPAMSYATYWEKQTEEEVGVWRPLAARFLGWEEGQ